MFFDLICSVLFEKRLLCVFIGIQFLSAATAMARLGNKSRREITLIKYIEDNFPA